VVESNGLIERPADLARLGEQARSDDPARPRLIALAWLGSFSTITGVGLYSYPSTLGVIRRGLIIAHDVIGDLLVAVAIAYFIVHLARTWRMKKRVVSRWTGYVAITAFAIAAVTGIYGQVADMPSGSAASWVHAISSLALVVLACFHGAWGLRPASARRSK
jgi:hypothetical protein